MPNLSYVQIQQLLVNAQALGLDEVSVSGLREALVMQNAVLTPLQRLGIELMQAPPTTRQIVKDFAVRFEAVNSLTMKKGRTVLLATSDNEWERMVNASGNNS